MSAVTQRRIGSLTTVPLALGTMHFGSAVAPATAMECLEVANDLGLTFWDTANNYAFWAGGSGHESETLLGHWFAARGTAARDRVTLASKVGAKPRPGYSELEHVQGLSARAVRDQVTGSLQRLRTDHLDLLYAHIDDATVPLAETLGVFGELVDEGLVREVGASNMSAERLGAALAQPATHPYRVLQQRFTYLPITAGTDTAPQVVLDEATERVATSAGVTLVGYSPLLSGAYTRADRPLPRDYDTRENAERVETLRSVADDNGLDAGQTVLAWMVQRSTPVLPIVGVSRTAHVHSAWDAINSRLPRAAVHRLDEARGRDRGTE